MNKKAQNDLLGPLISLFLVIVLVPIFITVIWSMSNTITKDQCKPFIEESENLKIQLQTNNDVLIQTQNLLEQCKYEYSELENNSITKQDFEEIKGYFNLTQINVASINNKIDNIDRIYNFYTIKNYSIALNLVLILEIFSLLFFKSELGLLIFNFIRKKVKKNKNDKK